MSAFLSNIQIFILCKTVTFQYIFVSMATIIVHDHENKKSSIETDSPLLTSNIAKMLIVGMDVICHEIGPHNPKTLHDYTIERGVYYGFVDEYETNTGKRMNKW